MINNAISLAILVIYPLLGISFSAAFIPLQLAETMIIFWLAMIYGCAGMMAAIHIKALNTIAMKPISNGLILGGLSVILGIQSLHISLDSSPGHMFFSLLISLAMIIYLAYKKVNKNNKPETLLEG